MQTAKLFKEFVEALDQEIKAVKNGAGGSGVKIFNGQLIREISGFYIYLFHLESILTVLDDSPATLDINGTRYHAQVIMTHGLQVEVSIDRYLGKYIKDANLFTDLWYLLELLKKRFEEFIDISAADQKFCLANKLFENDFLKDNSTINTEIKYSSSKFNPNYSQHQAIVSSVLSPISIIWGPPGTGKTATIAKAVEVHIKAGRRVLLVSHANNAVDEALCDVAEQMKSTSFYNEGKLIRLGIPPDNRLLQRLSNEFPLVLLDNIAEKLGATLSREKTELLNKKTSIQSSMGQIQDAISSSETIVRLKEEMNRFDESIWDIATERRNVDLSHEKLVKQGKEYSQKLVNAKSSTRFIRFIKGLDPQKIQNDLYKLSFSIDATERQINELMNKAQELQVLKEKLQKEIELVESSFSDLLKQLKMSVNQLAVKKATLLKELDIVQSRISEIDRMLSEVQANILSNAQLVATTLTKTFSSRVFPQTPFDVVILDEASMAPLPHFYWALGYCTSFVTIVGDFLQLPPICISKNEIAKKWLGRSIFDVLGIKRVKEALSDKRINLLDIQYRMRPEISQIPKRYFYEDNIKDGQDMNQTHSFDGISTSPLVLIDSSSANPWCNKLAGRSRYNLYHAVLSASIAERILEESPEEQIGILTPYAPQARLINKIAKDKNLLGKLRISTVHKFQGGQESTIIIDTVEANGLRIAPMLSETKADSDARLILNVAFTRAKNRIYLIAHLNHLLTGLNKTSSLGRIINHFMENATLIDSVSLLDRYLVSDFEKWAKAMLGSPISGDSKTIRSFYTEKNFYRQFFEDISKVKEKIIIVSPFLSIRRSGLFVDYFRVLATKGIEVKVFTKPLIEQSSELSEQSQVVMEQLKAVGVKVIERYKIHNKTAIIDNDILWDGSLNILSHRDTGENMWRFEGREAVEEVLKNLELDDNQAINALSDEVCPICGNPMIFKKSRFGTFLSCATYPSCRGKAPVKYIRKSKKR